MERIGSVGLSVQHLGVDRLDRVVPPVTDAEWRALADAIGASELVVLSTCNRIEVYFAREEGDPPSEDDVEAVRSLLSPTSLTTGDPLPWQLRSGTGVVRHLFRVTSSLDSLVIGEHEIVGQVRRAYARGSDLCLVGPLLGPLFHHSLQVGKRVRASTGISHHPVSVAGLAVRELMERKSTTAVRVAVVGAGQTGMRLARVLAAAGRSPAVIVNRSLERAVALAATCGARASTLEEFCAGQVPIDVVFSATSAQGVVLDAASLDRLAARRNDASGPLLVFDLSVPRDVEPIVHPRIEIIDLDDLREAADRNRVLREEAAGDAERLVEESVEAFIRRSDEDVAGPLVRDLKAVSEDLFNRELQALLSGRLANFSEADRRAIERWARATFSRLMTLPVSAMKQLASDMSTTARTPGRPREKQLQ